MVNNSGIWTIIEYFRDKITLTAMDWLYQNSDLPASVPWVPWLKVHVSQDFFLFLIMCMSQRGRYLQKLEEGLWMLWRFGLPDPQWHGCWELLCFCQNCLSQSHLSSLNFSVIAYIIWDRDSPCSPHCLLSSSWVLHHHSQSLNDFFGGVGKNIWKTAKVIPHKFDGVPWLVLNCLCSCWVIPNEVISS